MTNKHDILGRLLALAALATASACDGTQTEEAPGGMGENARRREREAQLRQACASDLTFARLKEYAFDEAQRIRGTEERLLDDIATYSVVRMEDPVVKSRDEELNVTVCSGRFILELPPGAENAFDGSRRLAADVEYAAQAAVDGSGLVYHMTGAEPIIYRLATVGGLRPVARQYAEAPARPTAATPAPPQTAPGAPPPAEAAPRPAAPKAESRPRPSYNCRHAGTRTEFMVCANPALAARDRRMASVYYDAMSVADGPTRRWLRRSRDRFLARRERCRTEGCVAAAYDQRVRQIRRVADDD